VKTADGPVPAGALAVKAPRIGMYSPWTGGNMDEGWTAGCSSSTTSRRPRCTTPTSARAGCATSTDVIILPDQGSRAIVDGSTGQNVRAEYRGGIGDEGVSALREFGRKEDARLGRRAAFRSGTGIARRAG